MNVCKESEIHETGKDVFLESVMEREVFAWFFHSLKRSSKQAIDVKDSIFVSVSILYISQSTSSRH